MSLPTNDKKGNRQSGKNNHGAAANSKFITKPGKTVNVAKKPVKTGGTRGS